MSASTVQAKPGSGGDPAFVGASLTSPTTGFGPSATIILTDGTNGEFLNPGQQTKAHSVPVVLPSDQIVTTAEDAISTVVGPTSDVTVASTAKRVDGTPQSGRRYIEIVNHGPGPAYLGHANTVTTLATGGNAIGTIIGEGGTKRCPNDDTVAHWLISDVAITYSVEEGK